MTHLCLAVGLAVAIGLNVCAIAAIAWPPRSAPVMRAPELLVEPTRQHVAGCSWVIRNCRYV